MTKGTKRKFSTIEEENEFDSNENEHKKLKIKLHKTSKTCKNTRRMIHLKQKFLSLWCFFNFNFQHVNFSKIFVRKLFMWLRTTSESWLCWHLQIKFSSTSSTFWKSFALQIRCIRWNYLYIERWFSKKIVWIFWLWNRITIWRYRVRLLSSQRSERLLFSTGPTRPFKPLWILWT